MNKMNNDLIVFAYNSEHVEKAGCYPNELMQADFEYIHKDLNDINKSFVRLGFHLYELRSYYHKGQTCGYIDFYSLCLKNFGLDKTQVSRLIGICERFCRQDNTYLPSMFINKRFADYTYSQLSEMLPLKEDNLKHIKPDMSVKEIREFKKSLKSRVDVNINLDNATEGSKPEDPGSVVATSQQERKKLCVNDLCTLKGAALYSKIKNADPVDSIKANYRVSLYDVNGKLIDDYECSVLLMGEKSLVVRLKEDPPE